MNDHNIFFFKEGVTLRLSGPNQIRQWIRKLARKEGFSISNINYIFCNDRYLRKINKQYLNHDYFTDIVTFDNLPGKKVIEGDIFISIDRVRKNSILYKNIFRDELHRVMAHGVLHLLGYRDKSSAQKAEMKKMEDRWLRSRDF